MDEPRRRWRLILGNDAQNPDRSPWPGTLSDSDRQLDEVLDYLFQHEYSRDQRVLRDRSANQQGSQLNLPRWLGEIRKLFPKSTAESLIRIALDRYKLSEILTDEQTLQSIEPNTDLLRTLLAIKELIPDKLMNVVRRIIARVVEELSAKLNSEVQRAFSGAVHRRATSPFKSSRDFDVVRTIRKNMKNYQHDEQTLIVDRVFFRARSTRRHPWDVILLVDQSGSMVDSIIHSAVLASILRQLPMLRTKLLLFDTELVDLSEQSSDIVETLLRVQLGGGTDIGMAMQYARTLVANPRKTIVVLVSDFFEGGTPERLLRIVAELAESGCILLGLAALDDRADPAYNRDLARKLAAHGMNIGAMTPDRLAEWIAQRVRA